MSHPFVPSSSSRPALPAAPSPTSSPPASPSGAVGSFPCSDPRCSAAAHDDSDGWLASEDARTDAAITRHGWLVQGVLGDGRCQPDLAYTVGLWSMHHPEIVVFGLPVEVAHPLLNDLGERVRSGARLHAGWVLSFTAWPHRVQLLAVPHPERVLFQATRTYGRPVPALQAVWDDVGGRFPWEEGYSAPGWLQPMPDSPSWRA